MKHHTLAALGIVFLGGCQHVLSSGQTTGQSHQGSNGGSKMQVPNTYTAASAENDAESAIAKKDFRLLAAANKIISVPGVDMQRYSLELLEKQCGIRMLEGLGDTVQIGEDLEPRKAIRQYALTYNTIIFKACQVFQKKYS